MKTDYLPIAEAIEKGRNENPNVTHLQARMFTFIGPEVCGACALGFAALGLGLEPSCGDAVYNKLRETFGDDSVECVLQLNDGAGLEIADIIRQLNTDH
jgi:hypothetical protein